MNFVVKKKVNSVKLSILILMSIFFCILFSFSTGEIAVKAETVDNEYGYLNVRVEDYVLYIDYEFYKYKSSNDNVYICEYEILRNVNGSYKTEYSTRFDYVTGSDKLNKLYNYNIGLFSIPYRFKVGETYMFLVEISYAGSNGIPYGVLYNSRAYFNPAEVVEFPPVPVVEGYEFAGWFYDEELTDAYDGELIFEDTTLYAGWRKTERPVMEHFNFVGWYYDESLTEPYNNEIIKLDTPLYPKWVNKKYMINFVCPPLFINSIQVDSLTEFTPEKLQRPGYNFEGWFLDDTFTVEWVDGSPVTSPLTLYAKWSVIMCKVTFIVNGDTYAELDVPWGTALVSAREFLQNYYLQSFELYIDSELAQEVDYSDKVNKDMVLYTKVVNTTEPQEQVWYLVVFDWIKENWLYLLLPISALGVILLLIKILKGGK
ncbi:MAG TPA: InlB B-repeat-containing protein [Clostridia bacterium]